MSYLPDIGADVLYVSPNATVANGGTIDSGWIDMVNASKYQISYFTSDADVDFEIQSSYDNDSTADITTPVEYTGTFFLSMLPVRQRYVRLVMTNNTGPSVTAGMEIKAVYGGVEGSSVFPSVVAPAEFSPALLTQAILIGQDESSTYRNAIINQAGALLTSDFGTEVARDVYSGFNIDTKFGRNPDVDTGSTPEDMWNGGSLYTGFNPTSAENLETFSADADDTGTLLSSGTATGGTTTTLVDSGATFVTDGAAVGDVVLNDTQAFHGYIASLTETEITVGQWYDGGADTYTFSSGDSYRVVTAGSTGAAVVKWIAPLDDNFEEFNSVYVILNGTTGVTTTGDFYRLSRGKVVHSGSSQLNEGVITARQAVTTANVFAVMSTFGQTTIGAFTVPAGKRCIIKSFSTGITRSTGASGSATVVLYIKECTYGSFNAKRVYEISTSTRVDRHYEGGLVVPPMTDVKVTVSAVSDNNTIADCEIEYYFIDD